MPPWELYVALPLCFGEISDPDTMKSIDHNILIHFPRSRSYWRTGFLLVWLKQLCFAKECAPETLTEMQCPNCGNTDLLPKFKCCPECGTPLLWASNEPKKKVEAIRQTFEQLGVVRNTKCTEDNNRQTQGNSFLLLIELSAKTE